MGAPDNQLIYFADPMCSWCWGFSPMAEKLAQRFEEIAPTTLVLGGLRPGNTEPLDDAGKQMIREHWEHVHTASGQPFDHSFFEREGFVYDTEPASRAVVASRQFDKKAGLSLLSRLHRAFYAENCDVTDEEVLVKLSAAHLRVDEHEFRQALTSDGARQDTLGDFRFSQELGIRGFPSLVARRGEDIAIVARGYAAYEAIEPALAKWFDGSFQEEALA